VVLFLPMGYFLPMLWEQFRPLWRCLLNGALIITAIELIQLLTLLGRCDIDDLLLNLLGIALGYALYCLQEHPDRTKPKG
jgi:glycopeptide antibiotics resistance protein